MNIQSKEQFVRQKAIQNRLSSRADRIYWSRHATAELVNDSLQRTDVEVALESASIIEDYPYQHRPLPDCLVLAALGTGEPIHAVIAIDQESDKIFIVTVYRPSEERWQDDWRTRK
jgi:hypothetical protein